MESNKFCAGLHDNLLDIPHPEPYNTNPNAPDINNAPSLGQLHEVPMGLAYITSAPCFEKNGPIRFKRSVSGNRYKSPAATGNAWSTLGQGNAEGSDGLKPFQPSTGELFIRLSSSFCGSADCCPRRWQNSSQLFPVAKLAGKYLDES